MTTTAPRSSAAHVSTEGTLVAPSHAEIIARVRDAFANGVTRSISWRRSQLEAMVRMLTEHEDDFVDALKQDLGRPSMEAFGADVGASRAEIKHTIKHFESWAKPRRASVSLTAMPGKARVISEPLGVALVVSPWNYPVQLFMLPMAAAIAAGNCVIGKPSELSPVTSSVLANLIPKYLDDNAVAVIEGGVAETTALLEQKFDHIFFTGSTRVGRVVMEAAAKNLTPVTLELGGKSPTIVAADADLNVAAHRIVWGKGMNAGQTCVAPDYVLAEASIRDDLVDRMVSVLREYYGDDPKDSVDFGRIVNEQHLGRLTTYLDDCGGKIVVGGESDAANRYLAPTIVTDPDIDSTLMNEEIFGPILPVLSVESVDAAVRFVLDRPKPLALYVFSGSSSTVDEVLTRTSSGGACVNHCLVHLLPSDLPFGGVGPSGMGAYHGQAGFDTFSHHKSVLYKPQKPDPKVLYPPYTGFKDKLAHRVM